MIRIARRSTFQIVRVWCVPHGMDIVVKSTVEGLCAGGYVREVYSFSSVYLRAQYNLITEMGVKC